MTLVIGLGNPGSAYAGTRHNLGAGLVEALLAPGQKLVAGKHGVRTADVTLGSKTVTVGIPSGYMNESGRPVARAVAKFKPRTLVVVYDELDLPFGRVRIRDGGGAGGHNGVKSVMDSLRTRDFLRLRIGIGRPAEGVDPVEHVLGRFTPEEREQIPAILSNAIGGLERLINDGIEPAQEWLHTRT